MDTASPASGKTQRRRQDCPRPVPSPGSLEGREEPLPTPACRLRSPLRWLEGFGQTLLPPLRPPLRAAGAAPSRWVLATSKEPQATCLAPWYCGCRPRLAWREGAPCPCQQGSRTQAGPSSCAALSPAWSPPSPPSRLAPASPQQAEMWDRTSALAADPVWVALRRGAAESPVGHLNRAQCEHALNTVIKAMRARRTDLSPTRRPFSRPQCTGGRVAVLLGQLPTGSPTPCPLGTPCPCAPQGRSWRGASGLSWGSLLGPCFKGSEPLLCVVTAPNLSGHRLHRGPWPGGQQGRTTVGRTTSTTPGQLCTQSGSPRRVPCCRLPPCLLPCKRGGPPFPPTCSVCSTLRSRRRWWPSPPRGPLPDLGQEAARARAAQPPLLLGHSAHWSPSHSPRGTARSGVLPAVGRASRGHLAFPSCRGS